MYSKYPKTINVLCIGMTITLLLAAFFPPWYLFGITDPKPFNSTDMTEIVKAKAVPVILSALPIMTLIFTVKLAFKLYIKERRR